MSKFTYNSRYKSIQVKTDKNRSLTLLKIPTSHTFFNLNESQADLFGERMAAILTKYYELEYGKPESSKESVAK